ncbi:MAG TPA: hypothetical protein VJ623_07690 [Holophagaceae bacterium]|nr:hypothetical protein [Holophagaceae bacterium]
MRIQTLLALVVLVSLAGCGGGGASDTPVPGPTDLQWEDDPGPNRYALIWKAPPAGTFDGYDLEIKVGTQAFQRANSTLIPPSAIRIHLDVSNSPELTPFQIRMNAERGGHASAYSNTIDLKRRLNPPLYAQGSYDWTRTGLALSWAPNTSMADQVLIERVETDAYGFSIGDWAPLTTLDAPASTYLDTTAALGTWYLYRVINRKGADASAASFTPAPITTRPPAPSDPMATFDPATQSISLTWVKHFDFNDGTRIERAVCTSYGSPTGPWITLPAPAPTAQAAVDAAIAVNTYYTYRVVNLKGGAASDPSPNSTPVFAGVVAPSWASSFWWNTLNLAKVSWGNGAAYDAVTVQRAVCDDGGTPLAPWLDLATLPGDATTFEDASPQEFTSYRYRILGRKGITSSFATLSTQTVSTGMGTPTGLTATGEPEGTRLSWRNHGSTALRLVAKRKLQTAFSEWIDLAVLPPDSSTFVDPKPRLGMYLYQVVAESAAGAAASDPVLFNIPNPDDALALSVSRLEQANANFTRDAALTPQGFWGMVRDYPWFWMMESSAWPRFESTDAPLSPAIRGHLLHLDPQGNPHLVYLLRTSSVPAQNLLRHAWWNGTTWDVEDLATAPESNAPVYCWELDSTGTPHVLLMEGMGMFGSIGGLTYVHKVGGTWAREPLQGLQVDTGFNDFHLSLDARDTPHILLGTSMNPSTLDPLLECTQNDQGQWVASPLPTGIGLAALLEAFWTDDGNARLIYVSGASNTYSGGTVMDLQKVGGTWQPPIEITSNTVSTAGSSAKSADGSRLIFLLQTDLGPKAFHWDSRGWHETLVIRPGDIADGAPVLFQVGFDSGNKVHILARNRYTDDGFTDYHE